MGYPLVKGVKIQDILRTFSQEPEQRLGIFLLGLGMKQYDMKSKMTILLYLTLALFKCRSGMDCSFNAGIEGYLGERGMGGVG